MIRGYSPANSAEQQKIRHPSNNLSRHDKLYRQRDTVDGSAIKSAHHQMSGYGGSATLPFKHHSTTTNEDDDDCDYMDMTPTKRSAVNHFNHSLSYYRSPSHQHDIPSRRSRTDLPSPTSSERMKWGVNDQSSMTNHVRSQINYPIQNADSDDESDYADMTGGKTPKKYSSRNESRVRNSPALSRHSSFYGNSPAKSDAANNNYLDLPSRSLLKDKMDRYATNTSAHNTSYIRKGGFHKNDDDDYDDMKSMGSTSQSNHIFIKSSETRNDDAIDGNSMGDWLKSNHDYAELETTNRQTSHEFVVAPFRKRSGGMSMSSSSDSPSQMEDERFQKRDYNTVKPKVQTAAGRAAKKYLQMHSSVSMTAPHNIDQHQTGATGVVRSTSRSGKPGPVQSRINKVRQSHSFKNGKDTEPQDFTDKFQSSKHLTSLHRTSSDHFHKDAGEIIKQKSATFGKPLSVNADMERLSIYEENNFINQYEAMEKKGGKVLDGSQMMRFISTGDRSQSLDKKYLEWLSKTSPFASRSASATSYEKNESNLSMSTLEESLSQEVFHDKKQSRKTDTSGFFKPNGPSLTKKSQSMRVKSRDEYILTSSLSSIDCDDVRNAKDQEIISNESSKSVNKTKKFRKSLKFGSKKKKTSKDDQVANKNKSQKKSAEKNRTRSQGNERDVVASRTLYSTFSSPSLLSETPTDNGMVVVKPPTGHSPIKHNFNLQNSSARGRTLSSQTTQNHLKSSSKVKSLGRKYHKS